ncbi:hypothetical protein Forpi1262_v018951 [Fusarium oxysporum f. sp. raphani]|uniref:Endonuclease/exonuclease/phosphatase domain-containing protein n=1 Tax=Fusarium oxysporum f. sp. raphani TaxID=96318 RepID=A0A8J5NEW7_FUSOX|nr:hypothetical protein Forpi1262_v018951 [Fusarium oxysporum f. sp. raphani]
MRWILYCNGRYLIAASWQATSTLDIIHGRQAQLRTAATRLPPGHRKWPRPAETSDIPTNPHGNTIDLAFSNVPLAEANVEDHLATSSDHFTLSLTLPNVEPAPTQPGKIRVTTDDELKRFVEIVELGSTAIPVAPQAH